MGWRFLVFAFLTLAVAASAQQGNTSDQSGGSKTVQPAEGSPRFVPPHSDSVQASDLGPATGQSSSKDTQIDLAPPDDDAKTHPQSSAAMAEAETEMLGGSNGISEFHTWDPHKAAKNIEVGDFYFKRKNY
ncbi:MAG: hypothetical protein WBW82_11990, partial [Candidatus Sulfotelmatobacter sp.]